MVLVLLILIGFLSYFFVGIFRKYAIEKDLLDHPNSRSSHLSPVPLGGGIVFLFLWAIFLVILYFIGVIKIKYFFVFFPSVFLISFVGFFDDRYMLAARWRFLAQLGAAIYSLIVVGGLSSLNLGVGAIYCGWFGYILMALALLWSTNLYNFMDGIDGIAAIEALFVFGFGGYFVWSAGGISLAYASWGLVFVVSGFLVWNKPPAKIFMGDAGSTLLGFLVALFAIIGEKKYNVPVLLWVILYGVFWFDATLTLIRRLIHGDKFYLPHKLAAFQRLQLVQWSHGKILLGVVIINIVLSVLAFLAFCFPRYVLIYLAIAIVILSTIYVFIERLQPMYPRPSDGNFS